MGRSRGRARDDGYQRVRGQNQSTGGPGGDATSRKFPEHCWAHPSLLKGDVVRGWGPTTEHDTPPPACLGHGLLRSTHTGAQAAAKQSRHQERPFRSHLVVPAKCKQNTSPETHLTVGREPLSSSVHTGSIYWGPAGCRTRLQAQLCALAPGKTAGSGLFQGHERQEGR